MIIPAITSVFFAHCLAVGEPLATLKNLTAPSFTMTPMIYTTAFSAMFAILTPACYNFPLPRRRDC